MIVARVLPLLTVVALLSDSVAAPEVGAGQGACYPLNSSSEGYLTWIRKAYARSGLSDPEYTIRRVSDGFPVLDPARITRVTSDSLCAVAAGAFARRMGAPDSTFFTPVTVLTIDTLGYVVTPHHTLGTTMLTMTFNRRWTQIGGTVWRDTTPAVRR